MYRPAHFDETRPEVIETAMARYPLATLVTLGSAGIAAGHLPLLYCPTEGGLGVLRGHMARANPQWQDLAPDSECLAIFSGPQHYVSPNWYPSKKEHGKVVPTWNYVAVHARGTPVLKSDPAWLLENVRALSDTHEKLNERPWRVTDAPREYIENLLKAIIGVELTITQLEGKWKVSQNRSVPDREGVLAGLHALNTDAARAMAELVRATLPPRHKFLASPDALEEFIAAWEAGTLAKAEWTHGAHVAVAAYYAVRYPSDALERTRSGILRYNAAVGTPNTDTSGYHETLTRLWAGVIAKLVDGIPDAFEAARHAVEKLGENRSLPRRYYSFDVVRSVEARRTWIPPDLKGPY